MEPVNTAATRRWWTEFLLTWRAMSYLEDRYYSTGYSLEEAWDSAELWRRREGDSAIATEILVYNLRTKGDGE